MPGTLTRWYPFAELGELRSHLDRMFDEFTDGRERAWTPAIDIVRQNGNMVVRADIPSERRPLPLPLPLPAGDVRAAPVDRGFETAGYRGDELAHLSDPQQLEGG